MTIFDIKLKVIFISYHLLITLLLISTAVIWFSCAENSDTEKREITFRVLTDSLSPSEKVYITGNEKELGIWDPNDIVLEKIESGAWEKAIQFKKGTELEFKFTKGSWATEALSPLGIEYPNFRLKVNKDTIFQVQFLQWRDTYNGVVQITPDRLINKLGRIEFIEGWRYQSGDDSTWGAPDYDDSQWTVVNPRLRPEELKQIIWNGIGWFRLHLSVDSTLWQKPFAFYLTQVGASEIYLNGRLIYEFGKVGLSPEEEEPFNPSQVRSISFDPKEEQILAIRYSNSSSEYFSTRGYFLGFNCGIADLNDSIIFGADFVRRNSIFQIIFTAIPLTLALIHLLLFVFYLPARDNLFYALFMISFSMLSFGNFQMFFTTNFMDLAIYSVLIFISINSALLFGLLTTYWRQYKYIPIQFYFFLAGSFVFTIINILWPTSDFSIWFLFFLAIAGIEIIRVIIGTIFLSAEKDWIGVIGFIALVISITYQLLLDNDVLDPIGENTIVYVYGILVLGITMSINLARDFARSNRQLLVKEREAHEKEIERRVMEADYSRKTQELEEARRLQVGMLPSEVPKLPHLEIAVYMKTATEVGGDYYDFNETSDGTLTIAIGDATGHGIKAGVMVALVKSLFNTMAHTFFIPDFFTHCTKMIRKMNFHNLYMSLMLVRINNHQLKVSAAGIPPLLIYRNSNQKVEEIVVKGLPLGGPSTANYEQKQTELNIGDVVLMMSDGYMELFNPSKETFEFDRVKEILKNNGSKKPDDIIQALVDAGEEWRGKQPQGDDVTFVILKLKK